MTYRIDPRLLPLLRIIGRIQQQAYEDGLARRRQTQQPNEQEWHLHNELYDALLKIPEAFRQ